MSYSPTLGRWMQRDPAGYVDGASLYEYERNSPALGVDPDGLQYVVGTPTLTREEEQQLARMEEDYKRAMQYGVPLPEQEMEKLQALRAKKGHKPQNGEIHMMSAGATGGMKKDENPKMPRKDVCTMPGPDDDYIKKDRWGGTNYTARPTARPVGEPIVFWLNGQWVAIGLYDFDAKLNTTIHDWFINDGDRFVLAMRGRLSEADLLLNEYLRRAKKHEDDISHLYNEIYSGAIGIGYGNSPEDAIDAASGNALAEADDKFDKYKYNQCMEIDRNYMRDHLLKVRGMVLGE